MARDNVRSRGGRRAIGDRDPSKFRVRPGDVLNVALGVASRWPHVAGFVAKKLDGDDTLEIRPLARRSSLDMLARPGGAVVTACLVRGGCQGQPVEIKRNAGGEDALVRRAPRCPGSLQAATQREKELGYSLTLGNCATCDYATPS